MANRNVQIEASSATEADVFVSPLLRPLQEGDAERWDEFVLGHPQGSFFQLTGWKNALEKTFGYKSSYFLAERDGRIVGVAPLFSISNWLQGRVLLSVPFGVYAGICAADAASEQALLNEAKRLAISQEADFLELRYRSGELLQDFHPNPLYATFTTPLSPDPDVNLKRLPRDTRYMIRKAEKAGLRAQTGIDQLKAFYLLFALNMHRHGTPLFPLRFFENLVREFGERVLLLMLYEGTRPISGVLSFLFRDTILPYYAGASEDAPRLAANNYMYWVLMKHAAAVGVRCFDFGRSKKGTGSYAFKAQWNMDVEELNYQVFLVKRQSVPNFSPLNPKFELAVRVWQRLPAWLAQRAGPRVVRWFP